ncbi:hypothetical protein EV13_1187 [Prochlorococcus sp. MIT 0702]|nr:hypothetical protein EV13_1187 [Prochlorococcus sp. MIT 0702]
MAIAAAVYPMAWKSLIEVTPSRLESLRPSELRISGVWAN